MSFNYDADGFEQFLRDMVPFTPGLMRDVAQAELYQTCREFFERSFAWTTMVEGVAVPVGDTPSDIQLDNVIGNTGSDALYAEHIAVLNVWLGNDDEGYLPLTKLGRRPDWWTQENPKPEAWWLDQGVKNFKLYPLVSEATTDVLRVEVALNLKEDPSPFDRAFPSLVKERWYDTIKHGFLARLYEHPSKPYSQPMMAERYRRKFLADIGYYAAQRKKGMNNTPNWRYPSGWTPRRRLRSG